MVLKRQAHLGTEQLHQGRDLLGASHQHRGQQGQQAAVARRRVADFKLLPEVWLRRGEAVRGARAN